MRYVRSLLDGEEADQVPLTLNGVDMMTQQVGGLFLDKTLWSCFLNGQKIELTRKETKFLAFMMDNVGKIIPSREILFNVWGVAQADNPMSKQYISVMLVNLRKKLSPDMFVTHPAKGYQILPPLYQGECPCCGRTSKPDSERASL